MKKSINNPFIWCLVLLTAVSVWAVSSEPNTSPVFKQEELDQILAPIALYPDSLLSQVLMASTYPLEVVQADRWAKQNNDLTGDALAAALEKETWDPSVKSLVTFPQVLTMMSEKLDWTQKLGDAFLAQQKEVMDTAQKLRSKAQEQGTLKTTEQQVVTAEPNIIIINSADPQVVYVPTYNPTVVYGTWPYPEYPPYYYYPPGYLYRATPYYFGTGVAVGAAWGYAWGHSNWHGGDVDIDVSRNLNLNQNINRGAYAKQYQATGRSGTGAWQHNPANRKGVAYRDQTTAQKFNRASTSDAVKSREAYRGRAEQGRKELASGSANRFKDQQSVGQRGGLQEKDVGGSRKIESRDLSSQGTQGMGQRSGSVGATQARTSDMMSRGSSSRGSAFQDMNKGGSAKSFSSRGQASRQSMSRPSGGGSRGGGRGGGRR